jgi:hypothetical protein
MMMFGIVGWFALWSHTIKAVGVIPGVLATSLNLGAFRLGDCSSPTAWHPAQVE